jgi:hypothetical protein
MIMKPLQFILIVFSLFLSSCLTTEYSLYSVIPDDPLEVKLLPLEVKNVGDQRFESDMIDSNICDTGDVKYGYITYAGMGKHSIEKTPIWMDILGVVSLGTLFFVFPIAIMHTVTEITYEIQDRNLKQLAKIKGSGKSKVPIGFYYQNRDFENGYFQAFNEAHQDIRNQLPKETVLKINQQLRETGTVDSD